MQILKSKLMTTEHPPHYKTNQNSMQQIFQKKLTANAKKALKKLLQEAKTKELEKIEAKILIAIIEKQPGSLGKFLIKKTTKHHFSKKQNMKKIYVSEVLLKAFQFASLSGDYYVGTEHLIFSYFKILEEKQNILNKNSWSRSNDETPRDQGNFPEMFGEINALIGNFLSPNRNNSSGKTKIINQYCINLNQNAQNEDHILIGRKNELERISNTLGRKMKNNPVLIGEPGVGKTAIVEGLAKQINENKAPFYLNNKRIFTLDLGLLVAGTNFRGEFENRLKEVVEEAKNNKDIILFIDEIHNLIGAGSAVGGMDAANLLKPALSRAEIQIIGATTFDEYHKYIEKDAALERRLQPIIVDEPKIEEALKILKGIKNNYEKYHQLEITPKALEDAVFLAKKYLTNRFLPDSAIDLIDEASARIRSKSQKHGIYNKLQEKKSHLQKIVEQKENLVLSDQYEEAIRLRDAEKKLEREIKILKEKIKSKKDPEIKVASQDIIETLSNSMNFPVELIKKDKKNIPQKSKTILKKNLFGQNHVIDSIYKTLICQFSHLANENRPLGSFLFIGPSGVGKTLTAKLVSNIISPEKENCLITINMSEFMEKHNISRLLGAPAGYVGYEEGGEFLDQIRKNPYSIVLFDEIEKADNQILNILLHILENGQIANAKGQNINFKNTIIILTSNVGIDRLNQISQIGFNENSKKIKNKIQKTKEDIQEELKTVLSAELLNRLDNIIFFNHLDKKTIAKIITKELSHIKEKLKKEKIYFNFNQAIVEKLSQESIDFNQGARLIHKKIKQEIEPLLAEKLLSEKNISNLNLVIKNKKLAVESKA